MKSSTGRIIALRYISDRNYGKNKNDYYTGTEAIELPTVAELTEMGLASMLGKKDHKITLKIGHATRNPKDQFVKKTGKELVVARLESSEALIMSLTSINLKNVGPNYSAIFSFGGFLFGLSEKRVIYIGFDPYDP